MSHNKSITVLLNCSSLKPVVLKFSYLGAEVKISSLIKHPVHHLTRAVCSHCCAKHSEDDMLLYWPFMEQQNQGSGC